MVHYYKSMEPMSMSLLGAFADVYMVAAGADGLSADEATWVRKVMESTGYYDMDTEKVAKLNVETVMTNYKEAMAKFGIEGDMGKLTAVDTARVAYGACMADGELAAAEAENIKKFAKWWGLDEEFVFKTAVYFHDTEKALITKKLGIICGDGGAWTAKDPKEGYKPYLSFERLHNCRSKVGLERDDINKQIKCLAAVVAVDGMGDLEKAWIKTYAVHCGATVKCTFDFEALPKVDAVKGILETVATNSGLDFTQLATELVYNCLRVCQVDGASVKEKPAIKTLAEALGVANKIEALSAQITEELAFRMEYMQKQAESGGVDLAALMAAAGGH